MESGTLTGSSCEPHFYIPIPLNAANTPLYGSCKFCGRLEDVNQIRLHTSMCVGDTLHIGSKHVTHRLEISFGYAKHYLDVFRLMSNLQVTCVDLCQRSHNVPTTYGQRMRNVWIIRWHTSQNFPHAWNFATYSAYYDVLPACFSVLLTYTQLTHNVFDVCQRIRQIFHTLAYAG